MKNRLSFVRNINVLLLGFLNYVSILTHRQIKELNLVLKVSGKVQCSNRIEALFNTDEYFPCVFFFSGTKCSFCSNKLAN